MCSNINVINVQNISGRVRNNKQEVKGKNGSKDMKKGRLISSVLSP